VNVGIVGVGQMGTPMVERLVAAGFPVRFHARRPEVVARVEALGASFADTLAGVADGADVVIVCVYEDEQVRQLCLGPDGLVAVMAVGATLVNHTTGSPTTASLLAAEAAPRRVRVLDAALSGGPADIARGALTLLVGGDEDLLDDVRPVLAAYSDPILHVGALGDGQRVKLVNNALFGANVGLVAEAERVAAGLGLDPMAALGAIRHCSGDSFVLRTVLALGSSARMQELAGRFIRKDLAVVTGVAGELGVDLGVLSTAALLQGDSA
jgi:3-hydroxyisobutyrate dehydrogenase-like beta-hydroxyacid dehydrogenase